MTITVTNNETRDTDIADNRRNAAGWSLGQLAEATVATDKAEATVASAEKGNKKAARAAASIALAVEADALATVGAMASGVATPSALAALVGEAAIANDAPTRLALVKRAARLQARAEALVKALRLA